MTTSDVRRTGMALVFLVFTGVMWLWPDKNDVEGATNAAAFGALAVAVAFGYLTRR